MIQIKEKKYGQTPGNDFYDKNVSRDLTSYEVCTCKYLCTYT